MRSIKKFIALVFCLFVGTSILLVAGICAADVTNQYYYSGPGNDLDNIMYMKLDFTKYTNDSEITLSFSAKYDHEPGDTVMAVYGGDLSNKTGPYLLEYFNGTELNWTTKEVDITTLARGAWDIGFLHQTDISGEGRKVYIDNILVIGDGEILLDDNGTSDNWNLEGFIRGSDTVLDSTPPDISQPPDILIEQNAIANITWTISDAYPNMYWVLKDGSEYVVYPEKYDNGEIEVPIDTSNTRNLSYTIVANDTSSNETSDQVNITVITAELPSVNITDPSTGYTTKENYVIVKGVVDGTGSIPTLTVNNIIKDINFTGLYNGTFSVSVSLKPGDNIINVNVTDATGMKDNDSITVNRKVSSSGGGGGGGGTSGEDYKNIAVSETEREYVNKDEKVSYSFDMEGNIVRHINFTGKTSSGRITAKVDMLKNTSTLVDHAPPGIVFKNMGIYVGNLGWANPNNVANPTIIFYVKKSWVTEYDIDDSTITLYRYSDKKWDPLETRLIDEDTSLLYFESKTPGFSQFAVTGTEVSAVQDSVEEVIEKPTIIVERKEPVTEQTQEEKGTGIPGFSLMTGIIIMLVVVQLLHRQK